MKERLSELMTYCLTLGADYADIRVKSIDTESISLNNGKIKEINSDRSIGFGIRIFLNGAAGFAAASDFDKLEETAAKAFNIARVSGMLQAEGTILTLLSILL